MRPCAGWVVHPVELDWVQFELNKEITLDKMRFLRGGRTCGTTVQVKVSDDGENWNTVFKGKPDTGELRFYGPDMGR